MNQTILTRVLVMALIYLGLFYAGGSSGRTLLFPVKMLVTFLHEFGHALGGMLTGGKVTGMEINLDGSGATTTLGGNRAIILMGGYLGSAVLGNLLFFIGARRSSITQPTLIILAVLMAISGIIWFKTMMTTLILLAFAIVLLFIALKTQWDKDVLMFLGLATTIYIVQDFNVGPRSDLAMYEETVGIFPQQIWMYIWLILSLVLCFWNFKRIMMNDE